MSDHPTNETVDEAISEYQAYLVEGERTAMRAAIAAAPTAAPTVDGVWCVDHGRFMQDGWSAVEHGACVIRTLLLGPIKEDDR